MAALMTWIMVDAGLFLAATFFAVAPQHGIPAPSPRELTLLRKIAALTTISLLVSITLAILFDLPVLLGLAAITVIASAYYPALLCVNMACGDSKADARDNVESQ